MGKYSTEEILNALSDESSDTFPKEFFQNEQSDVVGHLSNLLKKRDIKVKDILSDLGYERSYTYQMFNGNRTPTRIFILRLAFVLGLNLEETQYTLLVTGNPPLYVKVKYDAAIIFGLNHKYTIQQIENLLHELELSSLFW